MLAHAGSMALLVSAGTVGDGDDRRRPARLRLGRAGPADGGDARRLLRSRKAFASVMGFSSLVVMFGSVGGPLVIGLVADATGSYAGAFVALAVVGSLGAVAFFALGRPDPARPAAPGDAPDHGPRRPTVTEPTTTWRTRASASSHAAYARGDTSPVEVVEAYLGRLDAYDGALRSHVTVCRDAVRVGGARRRERDPRQGPRGPLHGIPLSHKDNLWTRGVRTGCHSRTSFDRARRGRDRGRPPARGGRRHVARQDEHHRVRVRRPGRPGDTPNPWDLRRCTAAPRAPARRARSRRASPPAPPAATPAARSAPRRALRRRRRQADVRAREPARVGAAVLVDGPRRPHRPHRRRRRHAAAGDGGRDPRDPTSDPRPVPDYGALRSRASTSPACGRRPGRALLRRPGAGRRRGGAGGAEGPRGPGRPSSCRSPAVGRRPRRGRPAC
jgi:hypothetical protein